MNRDGSRVRVGQVGNISSDSEVRETLFHLLEGLKDRVRRSERTGGDALIKVNLCLLKGPETGSTVDPRVAKALAEWLLRDGGFRKVYLAEADATHLGAEMAFRALGWYDHFRGMGGVEFFNLTLDETVPVAASRIGDLRMSRRMMEADLLVSLAKLKTHTQQKMTGIMKNQFGAIPYKYKIVYHPILAEAICDATAARPPDLCVVDGLVAMEGNGPTNGTPRRTRLLLASDDAFSIDHYCARIMGFRPMSVPFLRVASRRGLGCPGYEVLGEPPVPLNQKFRFLPKWKEIAKKGIGLMQREMINEEA